MAVAKTISFARVFSVILLVVSAQVSLVIGQLGMLAAKYCYKILLGNS